MIKKNTTRLLFAMMLFSLFSCSKKYNFLTSNVVPAARGYVKIKKDSNNNYSIKITVLNLAEVNRLDPPNQTYVVWILTDQSKVANIGQLKSSTPFMSNKLSASLETISSFRPIKVFITAESDANIQYPGSHEVLATANF